MLSGAIVAFASLRGIEISDEAADFFAERALGETSPAIVLASAFTVLVIVMIAVFDIRSSSDPAHARIPYLYLAYIAAGLAAYFVRRRARMR